MQHVEIYSDGSSRGNPGPGGYGTLMRYVDGINVSNGGEGTSLYSTAGSRFKKKCMQKIRNTS